MPKPPTNSIIRLSDRSEMTIAVYRGVKQQKTTTTTVTMEALYF